MFNTGSIPTSLYVYGFTNILPDKKTVSSKIDLRVGTLLGLMQGEEVNVYHVYKPQSLFKAKVTIATKETCVIEILDVEKFQKLIQDIYKLVFVVNNCFMYNRTRTSKLYHMSTYNVLWLVKTSSLFLLMLTIKKLVSNSNDLFIIIMII